MKGWKRGLALELISDAMGWELKGKRKYAFRKYSAVYAEAFKGERTRLLKRLDRRVRIEHVGSTAVPGLGGKNILDIIIGVERGGLVGIRKQLERAGYEFNADSGDLKPPPRLFLSRDTRYRGKRIRIHAHLTRLNNVHWVEQMAFRDYLRSNEDALREYAKVKIHAAAVAKGDRKRYIDAKDRFIKDATKKAIKLYRRSRLSGS